MKLTKCKNNHYYDGNKFPSCPHCINQKAAPRFSGILGLQQKKIPTKSPLLSEEIHYPALSQNNTVGWLVCLSGQMKGESFSLREGENRIGRSSNMDVSLFKEPSISRDTHAIISYSSDQNQFTLSAPNYSAALCCNGVPLKEPCFLSSKDQLQLGNCRLLFVPLCDETFNWKQYE